MDLREPDLRAVSYARRMRVWQIILASTVSLGACLTPPPDQGGWTGPNGDPVDGECHKDTDCPSASVCARDGSCYAPSDVTTVHINWTVGGMPASDATCKNAPDLSVDFEGDGYGGLGYAPVPCKSGKFTVDKLPAFYSGVTITRDGHGGAGVTGFFVNGSTTLDLPF